MHVETRLWVSAFAHIYGFSGACLAQPAKQSRQRDDKRRRGGGNQRGRGRWFFSLFSLLVLLSENKTPGSR